MKPRNYPPPDALAPYIRHFYLFDAELPDSFVLEDFVLAETAFVRVLIRGDWQGQVKSGDWTTAGQIVLFGANGIPMKVRVQGAFTVVGFAIRPSGWRSLFDVPHQQFADAMVPLEQVWGQWVGDLLPDFLAARTDEEIVDLMTAAITRRLEEINHRKSDPEMARFEVIARTDSTMRIEDAAAELGMSVRQLERRCLASFGLTPKAILRRSRFLDMAAAMRGFSSPTQHQLAALRYFDQSHLNREFRRFSGMTPGAFAKAVTPLQTAGLELREQDR